MKLITEHRKIELTGDNEGYMSIWTTDDNKIVIKRYAKRGNVTNIISNYESIELTGESNLTPFTMEKAEAVLKRVESGTPYSSAYIFYNGDYLKDIDMMKTDMEHQYTSTGIKFWRHQEAMLNYKNNDPNTVISSHISPEGACNLACSYCSVTYRDTHSRIPLETIQDYVIKLKSRGLKAVILTGGGEPLAYPKINELVKWLKFEQGIDLGLINNGTLTHRLDDDAWKAFSWVRVSINVFKDWEKRITLPVEKLDPECVVGASMVFTSEQEATADSDNNRLSIFKRVAAVVDRFGAKYVRILPNCLLDQEHLFLMHRAIDKTLEQFGDTRFFHQHKIHGAPEAHVCHQAYFRPYLSEEPFHGNGQPGTVYPCDSVVLNETFQFFAKKYQICHASDVLEFLDRKLEMQFDPTTACKGCVFTGNIDLLEKWKTNGEERFADYSLPLLHEKFV